MKTGIAGMMVVAGLAASAHADFSGPYAPNKWEFIGNGGSGSINTAGAPSEVTLTGDDSGLTGTYTQWQIKVPFGGTFKFNWLYTSTDTGDFDVGGYLTSTDGVNFDYVQLSDNATQGSGVIELTDVKQGTYLGFYVFSEDGVFGAGNMTISQFSGPVPAPGALALVGLAGAMSLRRRR